jgi:O-antigen ligase
MQLATGCTVGRWETWMAVLTWLGNLAAFFLAMQVCAADRVRRRFLDLLLYFGFVLSLVSVVQYFSSNGKIFWFYPTYAPAVLGPFLNRDHYAAFMEMLLPLAIVQMLAGQRPLRFAVMGAAMYASVIAGASRAGALLMTAELIVVPGLAWTRSCFPRERMRMTTGIWLLVFIFTAVVGWTVLWNRLQDPDPMKGRREILAASLTMARAKPYFGFGLGNYQNAYPKYATVDFGSIVNHAHNDWVEWAAEGGIPFSLLVLCIAAWSVPKAFKSLWGIGVPMVFVHSIVDFPLQDPVLEVWLFVLLGALAAENSAQRKS